MGGLTNSLWGGGGGVGVGVGLGVGVGQGVAVGRGVGVGAGVGVGVGVGMASIVARTAYTTVASISGGGSSSLEASARGNTAKQPVAASTTAPTMTRKAPLIPWAGGLILSQLHSRFTDVPAAKSLFPGADRIH
jgi:hypothetical protein